MEKIKPVLDWIKAHLLVTTMGALIIVFLACGWYYSGVLNTGLNSEVQARKKEFSKIDTAAKTSVSLPLTNGNFNGNGTLNKQLLDSLQVLSEQMSDDVTKARAVALEHNGDPSAGSFPGPEYQDRLANQGPTYTSNASSSDQAKWRDHESQRRSSGAKRILVSEKIFPNPPRDKSENLPIEVHKALVASYASMLEDAGAGKPPSITDVEADLTRVQSNFIQRDLNKGTSADLEPDEQDRLRKKLGEERLKFYNESAETTSFYADASAFQLPEDPFVTKSQHGLGELYEWHWNWWIAEDVIAAIMKTNASPDGQKTPVVSAPVKRLISLVSYDAPVSDGKSGGGNSGGNSRGKTKNSGIRGGGGESGSTAAGGPLPEPVISMDVATTADFGVSLTGRTSNDLYDVRTVELRVVVETTKLTELVNALSQQNFITITNIALQPTSAFDAAEYGFMYGAQPVSTVDMTLETIWFRKWTAAWMPESVRSALGVKSAPAGSKG
jgi:hypothetical protein